VLGSVQGVFLWQTRLRLSCEVDECKPLIHGRAHHPAPAAGAGAADGDERGRLVQVDPIKPTLKAPGSARLKLKYDNLLSRFAFHFNLRRHNKAVIREARRATRTNFPSSVLQAGAYRGQHSSTFQLDLSRLFSLTD